MTNTIYDIKYYRYEKELINLHKSILEDRSMLEKSSKNEFAWNDTKRRLYDLISLVTDTYRATNPKREVVARRRIGTSGQSHSKNVWTVMCFSPCHTLKSASAPVDTKKRLKRSWFVSGEKCAQLGNKTKPKKPKSCVWLICSRLLFLWWEWQIIHWWIKDQTTIWLVFHPNWQVHVFFLCETCWVQLLDRDCDRHGGINPSCVLVLFP